MGTPGHTDIIFPMSIPISWFFFGLMHIFGFVCRPTWDAGTQSHEGDGRDRVFETDGAAHLGRQVANDGRQSPDQQYGHDEGHVTVRHVYYIVDTQNSSQVVFQK